MRFIRRATQRAASFTAAIASVFLLATCDLDKLVNVDTSKAATLDSTDLVLTIPGTDLTIGDSGILATVAATPASGVQLTGATVEFTSSNESVILISKTTGAMTAKATGTAKITARILAAELGAGVTHSKDVRVRYKGIKVVTPVPVDSLTGLGQTRTISVQGTNKVNALVPGALVAESLRVRIAGVNDTSLLGISGTTVKAKKSGTSFVFAFFDGFKDSVAVKVRQVAKTVGFPTVDYTARHLNFGLTVPVNVTDVADSVIPPAAQIITWQTKNAANATITAAGVLTVKTPAGDSVFATMDGIKKGQKIVVAQVAGSMTKFAGDLQTDTVALPVAIVPTVTVLDSGLTPIVGASVKFKPGVGILNNATVQDTLQVTDANGRAKPTSWKLGDLVGAQTLVATSGAQSTTFNATAVNGVPKKLAFTVHPTSATIGTAIAPAIKVTIQDSLGNTVTSSTANVTLSISFNPGAATLAGTLTVAAVAGVATFSNISLNTGGAGYTLLASSGVLTAAISNSFDVFGAATKLGFTTQPAGTTAGATMSTIRVAIQDASGTKVSNSTASVTLAVSAGPGGAVLAGTTTVAAVAGVAEFTTLSLTPAGSGYILQATAPGLTGAASNSFVIAAVGAASQLGFSVQPTNVTASTAIAPAIKVQVLDANGALVTSSSQQVTLAIEASSPTGATLSGTLSQNAVQGVATFNDISINKTGTAYKLQATAGTLTAGVSTAFNVTPGAATKLGFAQQPTHTQFGQTISPAVTVEVQDAGGNRITTGSAVSVTVATTAGTCTGATLSGNAPTNTVSGVATFSLLSLSAAATSCTLTATATSLTPAVSTTFASVASGGPAKLSFTTEPSSTTGAGVVIATSPVVAIQDAAGNTVTTSSTSITLSVLSGPQTFFTGGGGSQSTTSTTTFANIRFNKAGQYRLLASATGFDSDTSAVITVSPGSVNYVGFIQQPGNTVAGVPFPQTLTVGVLDQYGNVVPGEIRPIELSYYKIGGSATPLFLNTGSAQATVTSAATGIATFTGLAPRTAGSAMYLVPRSTGIGESQSSTFIVSPAPLSKLGFVVQPPSNDTVGTVLTPAIQVSGQDSVGNTISDFSNAVTVALTGGAAGAVLSGTKTAAPTAGVSTFNNLSIDRTGSGYQLSASAVGVATATSTSFTIDPLFLSSTNVCCEKFTIVGDTAYIVHNNALKLVPRNGGTVTTIVGSTNATSITNDGTNVYWSERGTNNNGDAFIKKLTVSNRTVSTLTVGLASLMDAAESRMYSDGVNVYFIARNVPNNGYAIKSIPVGAVSGTPTDVYDVTFFNNPHFLLSGGLIYFYDASASAIRRMTTTGASLTTLSTTSVTGQRFTLLGTTLIFNDGVTIKSIANAPSAGGPVTPTTIMTAPGTVYELTSNNGFVYVNFDASLRRYQADFSAYVELSSSAVQWYPFFEFDSTGVYFMHNFGRVARVPK